MNMVGPDPDLSAPPSPCPGPALTEGKSVSFWKAQMYSSCCKEEVLEFTGMLWALGREQLPTPTHGNCHHPNSLGSNPHHDLLSTHEYAALASEGLGLSPLDLETFWLANLCHSGPISLWVVGTLI